MSETLALWVIKEFVGAAAEPVRKKLAALVLGDPLERALKKPTADALDGAVTTVLGPAATPAQHNRAVKVLEMFWTDDLHVSAGTADATITEILYRIVASGVSRATGAVTGLPGYEATTSLTALSDELGIRIDPDIFAAAFVAAWLTSIRDASLTNEDLRQLALLLSNEQIQQQVASLRLGLEEKLSEMVLTAIQSLREHAKSGEMGVPQRQQWFSIHIVPTHELMKDIAADYQTGFGETLIALQSGLGLNETMQQLELIRRRKITARLSLDTIAKRLKKLDDDKDLPGTNLDVPLLAYIEAAQSFKRSDSVLDKPEGTWYSDYISQFNRLVRMGEDPLLRSNYTEIAAVQDLRGQLMVPLKKIVDTLLPQRWVDYENAYFDLQQAALARPD